MLMNIDGLQEQLQNSNGTCFVAPGKKCIIGGIFVLLRLKVKSHCLATFLCTGTCIYRFEYVSLPLKRPVLIERLRVSFYNY